MKMRGTFCLAVITLLALLPATFAQPPAAYLQLWLQAESLANLNSGDKVASWEDSSGTGNTASNPDEATQPVYIAGALNGLPVVRFADGGNVANAGQYLDSLLTMNANGASFSAIVTLRSGADATARDTILQPLNEGIENNGRTALYLENNAGLIYKAKSFASETAFESARGCVPGEWTVYSLVQDSAAGTVSLWRNGDLDGTAPMGAFTTPSGQWRIGDNKPRTAGLQGDIAEILIYDAAIDPVDRAVAEDYLMTKYNLPRGGSGYDVLLRDNFNVSANSSDINFENTLGRQSTLGGPITYLENGVADAFTQVNNPDAPGMLRLLGTPTSNYAAVTPDRNFTDGGNFKIEFDLDAGINDAGGTSADWACIVFGSSTRGSSFVNASDGMGILFRNNGPIQVFNGAADTGGGGTLPLGLLHVRIEVSAADFQGSPATVRMFVNDTQIQLGPGSLEYEKLDGFRGNYITLAGAAWGGDWVHGFDNLLVAAQPCITPSVFQVKSYPGQNNQSVTVQIPAFLNLNGAVEVTVTSENPEIAEPVDATAGSLTLDFPPGVTSRSFNISALAHGSTIFTLTGPEGSCVGGGITVGVGASLVANPSFEENYNTAWPHYGPINQWVQLPGGGGTGVNEADGPFHDNGVIPDGNRVALHQGNGGISQMITGLAPGQQYWLQFRYNKRTGGAMALSTYFAGVELDAIQSIPMAGPGEYHFRNLVFTPASDNGLLEFRCTATGDATLLLDAVTLIPRGTNQIVVQNPSFEASGEVASPGVMAKLAGWTGTGVFGVNRIGQDNADVGWNPDQDHVAFIQGVGSLSQVISNLAIGQLYQIKYAASAKSTDLPTLRVSMGDLVLSEDLVYAGNPGEVYYQYVLEWIATDRAAELKFEQLDDLGGALLLDDIQITGLALPAPETKLSVLNTEFFAGQPLGATNVTVTLPLYMTATQSIDVVVISLNPNVAVPVGAIDGSLTLRFTAGGPNTLSFDVVALGSGTATFIITNQVDCPGAVFTVRNRTSLIANPSFEDNGTSAWPGYTEIANWKGGSGLNPITEDHPNGRSPFADNGLIPDRGQVAIIQNGPNAITQELYGLDPGRQYWLQVYVNARNCCGDLPMGSVRFNGLELLPPTPVSVVGMDSPYHFVNVPFTPNSPTGKLELISAITPANGDRTLLLDAVSLVARQPGQIVIQNPSFEASGTPPVPGFVQPLAIAGWSGSGTYGVNISGNGPFADNGAAPEQDNVAFLQTEGSSISQTINGLIPGATYKLSYAYNARGGNTPQLTVTLNDLVVFDEIVSPVGGSQPYYNTNITFEADSESVVLRFTQSAADDQTILLDDVKLTGLSGQELQLTVQLLPAGMVRLSWPVSAGPGWLLLSAETLTDTWFESGLLVGEEGEEYVAYDDIASPFKFYRLTRP